MILSWFGSFSLGPLDVLCDLGGRGLLGVTVLDWHGDDVACLDNSAVAVLAATVLISAVAGASWKS